VAGGGDRLAAATVELYDPATGSWAPTGNMSAARSTHAAVLLPSGRVFVTGGCDRYGCFGRTDIYDPASGAWTAGATGATRGSHAMVILPSGKVLAIGGSSSTGYGQASTQLYDPTAGSWTDGPGLITPRLQH